ncbi:LysR family transcriptional regulator [Tropicimonas isoalkanivorans]|uniref:DNA-binding transcriptional regulator, LysR family n=1 Tax=Tropicimonas isoalkanivorans TaxID=441112 RepID=A0A1I1I5X5_9RHOB|nr:LysR family transcriptional regulator [Tropicimonas isoalkanivorans]SFC29608.1 DNA-binding transcriptional regulator, LysR family [Tropicimonas isoalkanivorans]
MELRHLRTFVAIAESGSLRRASERLHVVQPALSRTLAQHEEELGFALFTREKRRLRITPAGAAYLADARRLLRELELAAERARRLASGQEGLLRVGFHETAARSRKVTKSLRRFREDWPAIELRLHQAPTPVQLAQIEAADTDAGFVYAPEDLPDRFSATRIERHDLFLALAETHALAGEAVVSPAMLTDEPFVGLAREVNPGFFDLLYRAASAAGLRPRVVQETEGEWATINLVAVGLGVALVVSGTPESWVRGVVLRRVGGLELKLDLALVRLANGASPLVSRLEAAALMG